MDVKRAVRHCHGLYELFCNNSDGLQKGEAGTCNDYLVRLNRDFSNC